jgi:hypothetical protein
VSSVTKTTPLHLLADAAVWEHADPQSVGVVPSPGQHDVAAVILLDIPLGESDVGVLPLRDAENAASPQPSVTLPNGSFLPLRYLKGQAAGMEGMETDTDALGTPSGISLGTIESPESRDLMAPTESPSKTLDQAAREKEWNLFMDEILRPGA